MLLHLVKMDFVLNCCLFFRCDVSKREQIVELAAKVLKEVGEVTVLVNNAGIMPCHPFSMCTAEEIHKIFDINVFAHFWVSLDGNQLSKFVMSSLHFMPPYN